MVDDIEHKNFVSIDKARGQCLYDFLFGRDQKWIGSSPDFAKHEPIKKEFRA
jgi:hypothetical protein